MTKVDRHRKLFTDDRHRRPIPKFKDATVRSMSKLSDKTLHRKEEADNFLTTIADAYLFLSKVIRETFTRDFEWREFFKQCYQVGNKSLALVSVTGIIMGAVLTIQSRPVLEDFGAVSMLPGMVAISLVREMGPVITGLIFAGKVGSGMGAELGSMKVTEQIDAMEVSSTNPIRFLVVTRVLAATFMLPLLVLFADAMGILGSWAAANIKGSVTLTLFTAQAFSSLDFIDLLPAFIKTFFFGAVIGLVSTYKGFNAGRGTESVGAAANSAVVVSSLLLLFVDMIAVQITDMLS